MHLLLVISSLGGGGAERVMSRLADGWAASGVQVTLATFASAACDFFPVDGSIERRSFTDESQRAQSLWPHSLRRTHWLRTIIQQSRPDAVISFTDRTNVLVLLAAQGLGVPVIVSERIDPSMYDPGFVWTAGRRMIYPRAAAIVVQTRGIQKWAIANFPRTRSMVIPNPAPESVPIGTRSSSRQIIAVGRLTQQKGFDLLIDAFSRISSKWPDWCLKILGEGDARAELEAQVARLGLAGRVDLPGQQADAISQISETAVFVLSSRYEGFPNVLVEAMATGRAVVATNCPTGPSDLVESGVNGLLVSPEDPAELATAIDCLISQPELRQQYGDAARRTVERLSLPNILKQWNDLLQACCGRIPFKQTA
jgi:GalNAc-alpha-(1->4)-GalNAc-alpha-(1->3)-diNAcBac-PP-undecaprenol alpha-1,4-N-acetyl-D-galactosaminyltransferase